MGRRPLVGPVFKTDGDGAPVLVCSIRTRPATRLRTALLHEVPPGWRNLQPGRAVLRLQPRPTLLGSGVGGRPCVSWKQGLLWKGVRRYVQYPILCPPQALPAPSTQEVGRLPRRPPGRGVEFVIQQDQSFDRPRTAVPPFGYTIYVHEDDFELAQAALRGTSQLNNAACPIGGHWKRSLAERSVPLCPASLRPPQAPSTFHQRPGGRTAPRRPPGAGVEFVITRTVPPGGRLLRLWNLRPGRTWGRCSP